MLVNQFIRVTSGAFLSSKSQMNVKPIFISVMASALMAACGTAAPAPVATSAPAGAAVSSAPKSLPAEISSTEAKAKKDAGAFMLDVREQSEWNEVHMPGATLIPLGQLANRLKDLPKDKEIVVVCRSGNRSATGRDILKQAGFTSVTSMAGGMNDWQAKGFAVATGP